MTDQEAVESVDASLKLAQTIYDLLRKISDPNTAFPALALIAGTVAASLQLEEDANIGEMFDDWCSAAKAQYTEVKTQQQKDTH